MRATLDLVLLLLLTTAASAAPAPGGLDLPDTEMLDRPVSLSFEKERCSHVLRVLFEAAGLPVEIEPCVTGEVSIEMRNVSLEDALRALARMAEFTVSWDEPSGPFRVSCSGSGPEEPARVPVYRDPSASTITLRFLLEAEDRRGARRVLTRPTLAISLGQPAEMAIGISPVPVFDLDEEGVPYTRRSLPSIGLKAYVAAAPQPYPQELRGILEIATHDEQGQGTTRTASRAFVVELPPDDTPVEATRLKLSGKTYILIVEGRSP